MDKATTLLSQVSGIDKAFRLVIYMSKIVSIAHAKDKPTEYDLSTRLGNLSGPLSDTRMALRLFGLLPYAKILMSLQKGQVKMDRIELLQMLSMLIYYPCEHIYWLGAHKVLRVQNPDLWSRRSCQAWAVYLLLDLYVLTQTRAQTKEQKQDQQLKLTAVLADLPLAIHWSLASYPLPPLAVGVLGVISTIAGTQLKWKYL